jgi:hypothetical protein
LFIPDFLCVCVCVHACMHVEFHTTCQVYGL